MISDIPTQQEMLKGVPQAEGKWSTQKALEMEIAWKISEIFLFKSLQKKTDNLKKNKVAWGL